MESSPTNKHKPRGRETSPRTQKRRSLPPFDRHIRKMDRNKYQLSPSASDKSSQSYQSSLQSTILNKRSLKDFTLELSSRRKDSIDKKVLNFRSTYPIRTFKVQGWNNDFYTRMLDWSHSDFICAANTKDLFFYNMAIDDDLQCSIYRKYALEGQDQNISSIKFQPDNNKIAVGYTQGLLRCYDYYREKMVVNKKLHHWSRISALDWQGGLVFTGSKDYDLKSLDPKTGENCLEFAKFHYTEICGVKSNGMLLASGSQNLVAIYDLRKTSELLDSYRHKAAVRALEWLGKKTLISGGGRTDRKIKFWKDGHGVTQEIDTGSQVCELKASTNSNEIVSCQGFSLNQIIIWNRKGRKELTIHGHMDRVLYSALSPTGEHLATGAGDQQLKIWRFFKMKSQKDLQPAGLR